MPTGFKPNKQKVDTFIVKFSQPDRDWWCIWNLRIDGPVTPLMSLKQFRDYTKGMYMKVEGDMERWIDLVSRTGSGHPNLKPRHLLNSNRAGAEHQNLSLEQMIEAFPYGDN